MQLSTWRMAAWLNLLVLYAQCLHAQPAPKTGTLAGTVFDAWGDPVPLAEVTLIYHDGLRRSHDGLRRSLINGQSGRYFARDLPAGSYSLVVASPAVGVHTSTAIVKESQIVDVPVVLTITPETLDPPALGRSYMDPLRDKAEITPGQQGGDIEGFGPWPLDISQPSSVTKPAPASASKRARARTSSMEASLKISKTPSWIPATFSTERKNLAWWETCSAGVPAAPFARTIGFGSPLPKRNASTGD